MQIQRKTLKSFNGKHIVKQGQARFRKTLCLQYTFMKTTRKYWKLLNWNNSKTVDKRITPYR